MLDICAIMRLWYCLIAIVNVPPYIFIIVYQIRSPLYPFRLVKPIGGVIGRFAISALEEFVGSTFVSLGL